MAEDALGALVGRIAAGRTGGAPFAVGISGFGGAGKSTLARALCARLPGAVRVRGDDLLDPERSHRRSPDWDGAPRERLVGEVLEPFRAGRRVALRRYDWSARRLGEPEELPETRLILVDAVGLFHPLVMPWLDLTIWVDVHLTTATERGTRRDTALGRDHTRLWNEVWVPNELDFAARFRPREIADVRFTG